MVSVEAVPNAQEGPGYGFLEETGAGVCWVVRGEPAPSTRPGAEPMQARQRLSEGESVGLGPSRWGPSCKPLPQFPLL